MILSMNKVNRVFVHPVYFITERCFVFLLPEYALFSMIEPHCIRVNYL